MRARDAGLQIIRIGLAVCELVVVVFKLGVDFKTVVEEEVAADLDHAIAHDAG